MIRSLTLTPLQAVEVPGGLWRFTWPTGSPKAETFGDSDDLATLQHRNAKLRRFPFDVIPLEDQP